VASVLHGHGLAALRHHGITAPCIGCARGDSIRQAMGSALRRGTAGRHALPLPRSDAARNLAQCLGRLSVVVARCLMARIITSQARRPLCSARKVPSRVIVCVGPAGPVVILFGICPRNSIIRKTPGNRFSIRAFCIRLV
jgi:hypothetical protein